MMLSFMQAISNLSNMPMKLNYTHRDSTGKVVDQSFVTAPENATTTSYNLEVETTLDLSKFAFDAKEPPIDLTQEKSTDVIDLTQDKTTDVIDLTQDKTTDVIDLTQEPSKESRLQSLIESLQEAQKVLEARVASLERWKDSR